MYTLVPTSVPEYATVDSLEPTQPAHTQRSALKPTSPEGANLIYRTFCSCIFKHKYSYKYFIA